MSATIERTLANRRPPKLTYRCKFHIEYEAHGRKVQNAPTMSLRFLPKLGDAYYSEGPFGAPGHWFRVIGVPIAHSTGRQLKTMEIRLGPKESVREVVYHFLAEWSHTRLLGINP